MGNIYYVDPATGNDSNTGMSPDQAWATIAPMFAVSGSGTDRPEGDVVYVKRGTEHTLNNNIDVTQESTKFAIYGWPSSADAWYADRPQAGIDAGWDDDAAAFPKIRFAAPINMRTPTAYDVRLKGIEALHDVSSVFLVEKYNFLISHCKITSERPFGEEDGFVRAYVVSGYHQDHTCEISDCEFDTSVNLYSLTGRNNANNLPTGMFIAKRNKGKVQSEWVAYMKIETAAVNVLFEHNDLIVQKNVALIGQGGSYWVRAYARFIGNKLTALRGGGRLLFIDISYSLLEECVLEDNRIHGFFNVVYQRHVSGDRASYRVTMVEARNNIVDIDDDFIRCNTPNNDDLGMNVVIHGLSGNVGKAIVNVAGSDRFAKDGNLIDISCKNLSAHYVVEGVPGATELYPDASKPIRIELTNCAIASGVIWGVLLHDPVVLRMVDSSAGAVATFRGGSVITTAINCDIRQYNRETDATAVDLFARGGAYTGEWSTGMVDISGAHVSASRMNGVIRNSELSNTPGTSTFLEIFSSVVAGKPTPYRKITVFDEFAISLARRLNGSDTSIEAQSKEGRWFFSIDRIKLDKPQGKRHAKIYLASNSEEILNAKIDAHIFYVIDNVGHATSVSDIPLQRSQEEWSGLFAGYVSAEADVDFGFPDAADVYVSMIVHKSSGARADLYVDLQPSWS